jgi:hypothetical protein
MNELVSARRSTQTSTPTSTHTFFMGRFLFAAALALATMPVSHSFAQNSEEVSAKDFARMRCALDESDVYIQWRGNVYGQIEGERQKLLFDILGVNVARCLQSATGGWDLVTRELQLYRDPSTGETIHTWTNPWTSEVVPVMHVANDPVSHPLAPKPYMAQRAGDRLVFSVDVPLTYPNPLAGATEFEPYGNQPLYQAIEMFRFFIPADSLRAAKAKPGTAAASEETPRLNEVTLAWTRVSPWLPWMKMGARPGTLVSSAVGVKLPSYDALDPALRAEIDGRLPRYRFAPRCVPAARNVTSWTSFQQHFADYLSGARFPLPAPSLDDVCQTERPHGARK